MSLHSNDAFTFGDAGVPATATSSDSADKPKERLKPPPSILQGLSGTQLINMLAYYETDAGQQTLANDAAIAAGDTSSTGALDKLQFSERSSPGQPIDFNFAESFFPAPKTNVSSSTSGSPGAIDGSGPVNIDPNAGLTGENTGKGPGPGVGFDPALPTSPLGVGGIFGPTGGAEVPRNIAGEVPRHPSLRNVRRFARRRAASGFKGQTDTILTSGQGLTGPANTLKKVLLGS